MTTSAPAIPRSSRWLQVFGDAMQRHRRTIIAIQWSVVLLYVVLVTLPAFLPLPAQDVHLYDNLTLIAQFLFWGIWWPFVMLSMMLMGRVWCGVFCPEGTLTEFVSRRGLQRTIPRWLRWSGWPFVAFAVTTIYGQLVSVYEYPKATLLILGGSTIAAIAVGFVYGRGKRVWCRYLCPANGVFRLLARLSPVHFHTDSAAWRAAARTPAVDCAPLVDMRHLSSMADCHACGRCSGHRDAIRLQARSPAQEVMSLAPHEVSRWEVRLLVYGVLGIALGAFQWSASPWFVALKQAAATWLIEHDQLALLADNAPWWLLTHYREANDVFTWLDGILIVFYIGATAFVVGTWLLSCLRVATAILARTEAHWRLAYAFVPLAGAVVFVGLSMLTVTLLRAEGFALAWVPGARVAFLALGAAASGWLLWRSLAIIGAHGGRLAAWCVGMLGIAPVLVAFGLQFFVW